jgi:acyl carrier protein
MNKTVEERVLDLLKYHCDYIQHEMEISLEHDLNDDLEFDELAHVEMLLSIEEEFDIQIPDEDSEQFACGLDYVQYIKERILR